jgi:site-specific DNA-methyltransferase (adenine-specific)
MGNGWQEEPDLTKGTSEWEGWGTALKPALEPITVARKPLSEKTVAENVLKWSVGGLNIDACRVSTNGEKLDVGGRGKHSRGEGYGFEPMGEFEIPEGQGRFPANLIHDGSNEVVELFPNDAQRFFYCAKSSKSERNRGCEGLEERQYSHDGREKPIENAFQRNKSVATNNHPTVKPIALMEYLVKLVSREGSTILDPFMGSGTTGIACKNLNHHFIGIERDPDYLKIAEARIHSIPEKLL